MISPIQRRVNLFAPHTAWGAAPRQGRNRPRRSRLAARMRDRLAARGRPPRRPRPVAREARPPPRTQRPDAPGPRRVLYVGFAVR